MRALILSCNTGQGHNSAAAAIKEMMTEYGVLCDIEEALHFISDRTARIVPKAHDLIYCHAPALSRRGYRFAEKRRSAFSGDSSLCKFFSRGSGRLYRFCLEGQYDTVLCTHVFAAHIMTDVRKRYPLAARTYFLATDYTCSPGVEHSGLDHYIIPDLSLAGEFTKYGIAPDKIVAAGIPVQRMFCETTDKEAAKKAAGIPAGHRHLLMMCGSMGCGPMEKLAKRLSAGLSETQHLSIVCGTNKKLYGRLSRQFADKGNLHILGYVNKMALLMDSADLYVAKPGGVSVTEAAAKGLPMVLIDAVAGCEGYNLRYYTQRGCAVTARSVKDLAELCLSLLSDEATLQKMSAASLAAAGRNAADIICQHLMRQ